MPFSSANDPWWSWSTSRMPLAAAWMPAQAACYHSQSSNWSQRSSNKAQTMPLCKIFDVLPHQLQTEGFWLPVSLDLCPAHTQHNAVPIIQCVICKVCFISKLVSKLLSLLWKSSFVLVSNWALHILILIDCFYVFQIKQHQKHCTVSLIILLVFSSMPK